MECFGLEKGTPGPPTWLGRAAPSRSSGNCRGGSGCSASSRHFPWEAAPASPLACPPGIWGVVRAAPPPFLGAHFPGISRSPSSAWLGGHRSVWELPHSPGWDAPAPRIPTHSGRWGPSPPTFLGVLQGRSGRIRCLSGIAPGSPRSASSDAWDRVGTGSGGCGRAAPSHLSHRMSTAPPKPPPRDHSHPSHFFKGTTPCPSQLSVEDQPRISCGIIFIPSHLSMGIIPCPSPPLPWDHSQPISSFPRDHSLTLTFWVGLFFTHSTTTKPSFLTSPTFPKRSFSALPTFPKGIIPISLPPSQGTIPTFPGAVCRSSCHPPAAAGVFPAPSGAAPPLPFPELLYPQAWPPRRWKQPGWIGQQELRKFPLPWERSGASG